MPHFHDSLSFCHWNGTTLCLCTTQTGSLLIVHSFAQLRSQGNCRTTGISVETLCRKRREPRWWRRQRMQRGNRDINWGRTRMNGRALAQWRTQVLLQRLLPHWYVFPLTDPRRFKNAILTTRLISSKTCLILPKDSPFVCLLLWTVARLLVIAMLLRLSYTNNDTTRKCLVGQLKT